MFFIFHKMSWFAINMFQFRLSSSFLIIASFLFCFFLSHSTALVEQIRTIKKTSEARLEMMKKEVITVEGELEEVILAF